VTHLLRPIRNIARGTLHGGCPNMHITCKSNTGRRGCHPGQWQPQPPPSAHTHTHTPSSVQYRRFLFQPLPHFQLSLGLLFQLLPEPLLPLPLPLACTHWAHQRQADRACKGARATHRDTGASGRAGGRIARRRAALFVLRLNAVVHCLGARGRAARHTAGQGPSNKPRLSSRRPCPAPLSPASNRACRH